MVASFRFETSAQKEITIEGTENHREKRESSPSLLVITYFATPSLITLKGVTDILSAGWTAGDKRGQ